MKKTILLIVFTLFFHSLFAEIMSSGYVIPKDESEFDLDYYLPEGFKVMEPYDNPDLNVTQDFYAEIDGVKFEIVYSTFAEDGDSANRRNQFLFWSYLCAMNGSGNELSLQDFSWFNDEDVKKEFNGDYGVTIFIPEPKSKFSKDYKFMMMDCFAKEGQGMVIRTYLFNDLDFIFNKDGSINPDSPWLKSFHLFRFMN